MSELVNEEYHKGYNDGYSAGLDNLGELGVMEKSWVMETVARHLIFCSQSEDKDLQGDVVGLAKAVLLLAIEAHRERSKDYVKQKIATAATTPNVQ